MMLILQDADVAFMAEDGYAEQPWSRVNPVIIVGMAPWTVSGKKNNNSQIIFLTLPSPNTRSMALGQSGSPFLHFTQEDRDRTYRSHTEGCCGQVNVCTNGLETLHYQSNA